MLTPAEVTHSSYIEGLRTLATDNRFKHSARAARVLLYAEGLTECGWSDEWCECREVGVIHDVNGEDDADYCLRHFAMVEKTR